MYREGFERFRRRLHRLPPSPDPLTHVYRIAWAYRDSALTEPNYYRVMFGQAMPGFTPDCDTLAAASATFQILVDAARVCVDAGVFVAADPAEIAEVMWAAAHGVISLELAGHVDPSQAPHRYEAVVQATITWFVGKTDRTT